MAGTRSLLLSQLWKASFKALQRYQVPFQKPSLPIHTASRCCKGTAANSDLRLILTTIRVQTAWQFLYCDNLFRMQRKVRRMRGDPATIPEFCFLTILGESQRNCTLLQIKITMLLKSSCTIDFLKIYYHNNGCMSITS